jgi:hypothetical protein
MFVVGMHEMPLANTCECLQGEHVARPLGHPEFGYADGNGPTRDDDDFVTGRAEIGHLRA